MTAMEDPAAAMEDRTAADRAAAVATDRAVDLIGLDYFWVGFTGEF